MLIKIKGHEITDAAIEKISLVKRGANRSPFKLVKSDDQFGLTDGTTVQEPVTRPYQTSTEQQAPGAQAAYDENQETDLNNPKLAQPDGPVHRAAAARGQEDDDIDWLIRKGSAWAHRNAWNPFK